MEVVIDGENNVDGIELFGSFISKKIQQKILDKTQNMSEEIRDKAEISLNENWAVHNITYAGDMSDTTLSATNNVERSQNAITCTIELMAKGHAVSFIEFGTGVYYSDNHEYASTYGATRGSYGQGKGNQEAWYFYGTASDITNGLAGQLAYKNRKDSSDGYRHDLIRTRGNPPNRCMLVTYNDIKRILSDSKIKIKNEVANK